MVKDKAKAYISKLNEVNDDDDVGDECRKAWTVPGFGRSCCCVETT